MSIECPFNSISNAMVTHPRDWSLDYRDAWIYAIIFGWGQEWEEVANKHNWRREEVDRLKRLHQKFQDHLKDGIT